MELSWSTFILEAINFLVLVWILKRFLYKPVLDVIERRKAGIEKIQADAKALMRKQKKANSTTKAGLPTGVRSASRHATRCSGNSRRKGPAG